MKDYASAFLGLILAGVLLMVAGLGLMMSPARHAGASHPAVADASGVERAVYAERLTSPARPAIR